MAAAIYTIFTPYLQEQIAIDSINIFCYLYYLLQIVEMICTSVL